MTATLTAEEARAFALRAGMLPKPAQPSKAPVQPKPRLPREWNETIRDLAISIAADRFKTCYTEIRLRGRNEPVVSARQLAMLLCRSADLSFKEIGRLFSRNHTTVMHACEQARLFRHARQDIGVFLKALPSSPTGTRQWPSPCGAGDPHSQDDRAVAAATKIQ